MDSAFQTRDASYRLRERYNHQRKYSLGRGYMGRGARIA
jgi:hypothetical protein